MRWWTLCLIFWGSCVLAVNRDRHRGPDKKTGEDSSTNDREQQNGERDSEDCRRLRAEMAATILAPALEHSDSDWIQGLVHPRGPPPPMTTAADTATASSSRSSTSQPQEHGEPTNPTTTLSVQNAQQHTPPRAQRDRSRSVPREPVRRQRTSTLGRSAATLEDSLRSQSNQLTAEQRLSAIEVASCLRALFTRAGFSQETIAAGAGEARNSLLQRWALEDQQEHGEEEIDPTGALSARYSCFHYSIHEWRQRECQVQTKNWMNRHLRQVSLNITSKSPYHTIPNPLNTTPQYLLKKS